MSQELINMLPKNPCSSSDPVCRESQEWTYGIDNTGTRFNDTATYEIELSDGTVLTFDQTPTASWTPQLQQWANNIQQAADNAGLAWFVEPRFIDNTNPTNLDGTYPGPGGTPSGLPGASSEVVAQSLFDGGMAWRYVNIQICPGQPVPVRAYRTESILFTNNPYELTTAGAILGPLQKFKVCQDCNEGQDEWYVLDQSSQEYSLATSGQIPSCWEPCGTLTLTPAPPDRSCSFFYDLACDSNNETDPLLFTNQITRRATVCNGEQIAVDYFIEDPTDPSALVSYSLIGEFVDCDTGQPVDLPEPDGILIDCEGLIQTEERDTDVRIVGSKNPIPVFITDECCGDPLGYKMCYGGAEGSASYEIDDNETDGTFSIGGTGNDTIKWEVDSPASASDGLADVTIAIQNCINSGEVANITVVGNGITYTFSADSILSSGNTDGTGAWAFTGSGPASGSGKITSTSVTCGIESGRAFGVKSSCDEGLVRWFDDVTGTELSLEQIETLRECPLPELCETTTTQVINCATESGLTDDGTTISIGDQLLSIIQVDCNNIALGSNVYHVVSGELVSSAILTDQCDPDPQVEEIRECILDSNGVQWTQVSIIDPNDPDNPVTLYYDTQNRLGTPNGSPDEWSSCLDAKVEIRKLCEIDARFLLLIDSNGAFGRYSFYTGTWELVNTLSVNSAGGSADVANFRLYNFVAPDQLTVIDVNTDTQLPNVTVTDGVLKPGVLSNPKTFSAASFRDSDGFLYAQDTAGVDAGLYRVNVTTGVVDFVTNITGVVGTGTSIAIDNTIDTLYINGSNLSYEVDWVTGLATQVANPPIQPNGSTFDTDGNWYVTSGTDTYFLPSGTDGQDPQNWVQIIDDFGAGANSIAYYEVVSPQPSCFYRKYEVQRDGNLLYVSDHNVSDFSERTIVGDVDCCECSCNSISTGGSSSNPPIQDIVRSEICVNGKPSWRVETLSSGGVITVTFEDETGNIGVPASWTVGNCEDSFVTTFDSQFFTSALTVPTAPSDTNEVVVFNNSSAWLELDTNYGTQIIPPRGTIEFSINLGENGITFNSVSIINGSFEVSDTWGLNYKTQT